MQRSEASDSDHEILNNHSNLNSNNSSSDDDDGGEEEEELRVKQIDLFFVLINFDNNRLNQLERKLVERILLLKKKLLWTRTKMKTRMKMMIFLMKEVR